MDSVLPVFIVKEQTPPQLQLQQSALLDITVRLVVCSRLNEMNRVINLLQRLIIVLFAQQINTVLRQMLPKLVRLVTIVLEVTRKNHASLENMVIQQILHQKRLPVRLAQQVRRENSLLLLRITRHERQDTTAKLAPSLVFLKL
jgi:hypothetical protein